MTRGSFGRLMDGGVPHRTPAYRALGFSFGVRCTDPILVRYLETLFEPFQASGEPMTWYSLGEIAEAGAPLYVLYCDDVLLDTHREPSQVFSTLLWHVNRRVVADSQDHLLIHASAVTLEDVALLFPAPMESGKTTLAAGLVRAGFSYATDEIVALDPDSGLIEPFPRALSVDPGSWTVLADLCPEVPAGVERYLRDQWQVSPSSIRTDAIAGLTRIGYVITPRYSPGATSHLEPLPRASAVTEMAEHAFNFHTFGPAGLRLLARIARRSICRRLTVGDLDAACDLLRNLVYGVEPSRIHPVGAERS